MYSIRYIPENSYTEINYIILAIHCVQFMGITWRYKLHNIASTQFIRHLVENFENDCCESSRKH